MRKGRNAAFAKVMAFENDYQFMNNTNNNNRDINPPPKEFPPQKVYLSI